MNFTSKIYEKSNNSNSNVILSLDFREKNIFDTIVHKNNIKKDALGIFITSFYDVKHDKNLKYNLIKISIAIKKHRVLNVLYKSKNGQEKRFDLEPLGIIYYEFENMFYIIGQYMGKLIIYNLFKVIEINETKQIFERMKNFNIEEYCENIWGMEQGEAIKVKVKFLKEANVEYKFKRDVEFRKNKVITEYDSHLIYEDVIIGINSFNIWIRSFGSSAIVIEPQELRNDMILSAKKALEYYKR